MVRSVQWQLMVSEGDVRSELSLGLVGELETLSAKLLPTAIQWLGEDSLATPWDPDRAVAPTWVLLAEQDQPTGIRFIGMPTGYQFATILNAMLDVSRDRVLVEPRTYLWCQRLAAPVTLCVLVTPTCPHSPRMATLAERFARANPRRIHTDIIDVSTFPQYAERFGVREVPCLLAASPMDSGPALTVLGTVSERMLLEQLRSWQHHLPAR